MTVFFAGTVASGKSTYSRQVAERLGWPLFSFRGFVGECAARIGLDPEDRDTLQDLGLCLSKRPDRFCKAFLYWTGTPSNFIVDGLRHTEVFEELRRNLIPDQVRLAFIETPEGVARERHRARSKDRGELEAVRSHLVELGTTDLKSLADWIVDGSTGVGVEDIIVSINHKPR